MKKVRVKLGANGYSIHIGHGLLAQTGPELKEMGIDGKLVIITDPTVKSLYGSTLKQSLTSSGFQVLMLEIPEGEEHKSMETAGKLYQKLTDFYAERTTPILALGGGVIGDLSGFVAATYLRGVPLIQIPTTLLAQVDSSIGGKVAVNHGQLKNKVGTFYQPKLVIADVTTLQTLPEREISDGLAEVIKYGVISDDKFFTYIEDNLDQITSLDERALESIVFQAARIKAGVVEKDEKDFGLRNTLNYGHTIGHAVESISDFTVSHGEAVAIGMVVAARIANKLGILDKNALTRLKAVITRAGLPTSISGLQRKKLVQAMKHDKKILQGKIKFILLKSIGEVFITDEVEPAVLEQSLVEQND